MWTPIFSSYEVLNYTRKEFALGLTLWNQNTILSLCLQGSMLFVRPAFLNTEVMAAKTEELRHRTQAWETVPETGTGCVSRPLLCLRISFISMWFNSYVN